MRIFEFGRLQDAFPSETKPAAAPDDSWGSAEHSMRSQHPVPNVKTCQCFAVSDWTAQTKLFASMMAADGRSKVSITACIRESYLTPSSTKTRQRWMLVDFPRRDTAHCCQQYDCLQILSSLQLHRLGAFLRSRGDT